MNLFENLQLMNEAKETLVERTALSTSEYNKLKIALNKNNPMRGNFIFHPGEVREIDYKLRIDVYGAFKNFEHTKDARHAWRAAELKNDEATRDGVGAHLYIATINLIDETVKFTNMSYYLNDYVNKYQQFLVKNGDVNPEDIDVRSLVDSINNAIEVSKKDLEDALHSKNFIYNLTGKRNVKSKDDSSYNLDLESTQLTEDFDPSMPNWLMRAIKMNNEHRNYGHKDLNYRMPLDTMKWEVEPFPEKGKLANAADDEVIALLIDRSGDKHEGDYVVYFPSAWIGNNETIEINGRNRKIDSMSLRALAPYVKEYAHSIGSSDAKNDVGTKQKDRATAQDGSIERNPEHYYGDVDKSGYIVDPNKYKRLLAQNKHEEYSERLHDLYVVLYDLRTKFQEFMQQNDVIPEPGSGYGRNSLFNKGTRAYKEYDYALDNYNSATKSLDKIKEGSSSRWGEAFEEFEQEIKKSEMHVVNVLTIIEPSN